MRARHTVVFVLLLGLMLALPYAASADRGNGQAIGQDPTRLVLTKCSNAGGGQIESGTHIGSIAVLRSDCLGKEPGSTYTVAEFQAIQAQGNCSFGTVTFSCEISPGNSAGNHAGS